MKKKLSLESETRMHRIKRCLKARPHLLTEHFAMAPELADGSPYSTSGPLDFELEDPLLDYTPIPTKRKKVIGLDDLLTDYYTQKNKINATASRNSRGSKRFSSDDEDDKDEKCKEMKFAEIADQCEKQMNQIIAENDVPLWGLENFGPQKSLPLLSSLELENSKLLQHLRTNKLFLDIHMDSEQGAETFFEGLLINGWLLHLAFISGSVEAVVVSWTFYRALYCSNVELQYSACDFWCRILSSKKEDGASSVMLEWIPNYSELRDALEVYGYLPHTHENVAQKSISSSGAPDCKGPPANIISWIKILSACFQIRKFSSIFSACDAEDAIIVIIHLFLDRQLQGLLLILTECMESILSFFTDEEWPRSSEKVAHAISCGVPKDLNCLRAVECISGTSTRDKHLKSQMAVHFLGILFDKNVSDGKGILKSLLSVKVKDKDTDFFTLFIFLVLSEKWLFSHYLLQERSEFLNIWSKFVGNCSHNISSTDWRLYASKVRSKASYLLQSAGTGSH